jgi:prophage regulatory protein
MSCQNFSRLITRKELKELVPYSGTHIGRLERDGKFPIRIQLGPNRVGWSLNEINQWIEDRKNERPCCSSQEEGEA